jgi:hypothetical protein
MVRRLSRPGHVRFCCREQSRARDASVKFHRVDSLPIQSDAASGARRTRVRVVRSAEHDHKNTCLEYDAADATAERHGLSRDVGRQLFAGAVLQALLLNPAGSRSAQTL